RPAVSRATSYDVLLTAVLRANGRDFEQQKRNMLRFAGLALSIEPIHDGHDPFFRPRLDCLDERRHQVLHDRRIAFSKLAQHIVRQISSIAARRRGDADAQASVVLMPERAFDALETIVARRAAAGAKRKGASRESRFVD